MVQVSMRPVTMEIVLGVMAVHLHAQLSLDGSALDQLDPLQHAISSAVMESSKPPTEKHVMMEMLSTVMDALALVRLR